MVKTFQSRLANQEIARKSPFGRFWQRPKKWFRCFVTISDHRFFIHNQPFNPPQNKKERFK